MANPINHSGKAAISFRAYQEITDDSTVADSPPEHVRLSMILEYPLVTINAWTRQIIPDPVSTMSVADLDCAFAEKRLEWEAG